MEDGPGCRLCHRILIRRASPRTGFRRRGDIVRARRGSWVPGVRSVRW